jgi:dual specificity phosphatase 12
MDEVLPGLWVGDLACALSTEYLSLAGVTHIVTALKQRLPPPPTLPCGRKILAEHQRHVSIDDEESEPILVQFPAVNDFLEEV